ncbi:hypothetical protein V2J09_006111 [Rumex salicifolius]
MELLALVIPYCTKISEIKALTLVAGSLPAEFSELPKLQILQLDNSNCNGSEIPPSYGNMSRLLKLCIIVSFCERNHG